MKRILAGLVVLLGACKTNPPAPPMIHGDEAGLQQRVTLPGTAAKGYWCEQAMGSASPRVPGPTDWELQAILVYPTDQRAAVSAAIRARPTGPPVAQPATSCLPKTVFDLRPGLFGRMGHDVSGLAHSPLTVGMVAWDGSSGTMFVQAHTQ